MKFKLSFEIKSLPRMTNTMRVHWRVKQKEALKWKGLVASYLPFDIKPTQPLASAALTLTRCSARQPDADGLVSSFKHVIDGLVGSGILVDDGPKVIGFPSYKWEYASPGKGKIRVEVEEK